MQILLKRAQEFGEIFSRHLEENLLRKWYPLAVDDECGGYFTNVTVDWRFPPEQDKIIVPQARHIWTTSKAAAFVGNGAIYEAYARHGVEFLRKFMWDEKRGGFFQIRNRQGSYSGYGGWHEEKRTSGNASAVAALAAFYRVSKDPTVLGLAIDAFRWMEDHAYDPLYEGYFEFLTSNGEPIESTSRYTSAACDKGEPGYKDRNSSIHLLEAYTELYNVWKDDALQERLSALLHLIRDTIVTNKGYLQPLFTRDWTPVSSRRTPDETRTTCFDLEQVSFGHDCETAYLMLEASHALGTENDARTLSIAKRMLEHTIMDAWDQQAGGFYDSGYYLEGSDQCTIVKSAKTLWVQAEALNTLLIFSCIFPHDKVYQDLAEKQWSYIDKYLVDHQNGDWLEGDLDVEAHSITGSKRRMRQCAYHSARALMNCFALLSGEKRKSLGIGKRKSEMEKLVNHWKKT